MKLNLKTYEVNVLELDNGKKIFVPPNSIIRFVIDASKIEFDQWFIDTFYHKYFDKENNTYIFDMNCCKFKKNNVTGHLVDSFTIIPTLPYKALVNIEIISNNANVDIIKYALEYLHDADLCEFGNDNIEVLEKTMDILGIPYNSFN